MRKLVLTFLLLSLVSSAAFAQEKRDKCHVYIVDSKIAEEEFNNLTLDEAGSKAVKILGEFFPKIGEEETTTVHYTFPGSNFVITATVFYTDELMESKNTRASMLIGIMLSKKAQGDALSSTDNSMAEVTYGLNADKVRTKKFVKIKGHTYLIGLECECNIKPDAK